MNGCYDLTAERCGTKANKELRYRNGTRAVSVYRRYIDHGVGGKKGDCQVCTRVGPADIADDRSEISDLNVADLSCRISDPRHASRATGACRHIGKRDKRAKL